jgi:hypothetical protein
MSEALQAQLAVLGKKVRAAAIPDGCKHTTGWCIGKLPPLYAKFRETNESRYGEEITRLVQGMLKELTTSDRSGPVAQKLATNITNRLQLLHEQFGLPVLNLKAPATIRRSKVGLRPSPLGKDD